MRRSGVTRLPPRVMWSGHCLMRAPRTPAIDTDSNAATSRVIKLGGGGMRLSQRRLV